MGFLLLSIVPRPCPKFLPGRPARRSHRATRGFGGTLTPPCLMKGRTPQANGPPPSSPFAFIYMIFQRSIHDSSTVIPVLSPFGLFIFPFFLGCPQLTSLECHLRVYTSAKLLQKSTLFLWDVFRYYLLSLLVCCLHVCCDKTNSKSTTTEFSNLGLK